MLGNGRLEALCFDGSKRLANVRPPFFFTHLLLLLVEEKPHHVF